MIATEESNSVTGTAQVHVTITSVELVNMIPTEFALAQNYPNPFNPITTIEYSVKEQGHVLLKVYNVLGNELAVVVDRYHQPGRYKVSIDAQHLPTGLYFYCIEMKDFYAARKMVVVK